jgi:hypothetical protein
MRDMNTFSNTALNQRKGVPEKRVEFDCSVNQFGRRPTGSLISQSPSLFFLEFNSPITNQKKTTAPSILVTRKPVKYE